MQKSLGFSPNELVFAHKVCGQLGALADNWKNVEPPVNLIDFVNGFRHHLFTAGTLVKEKLPLSQEKMKSWYDRSAERCMFSPGDQVLALFPVVSSPFQAKFAGPYSIVKKVSNQKYIISMPERRKSTQLCHVNLLKPYFACALQSSACSSHSAVSHAHAVCVADSAVPVKSDCIDIGNALGDVEQMYVGYFKNSGFG